MSDDDKDGWMFNYEQSKTVGDEIEMSIPKKDGVLIRKRTRVSTDTPINRVVMKPKHNTIREEPDGRLYLFARIISIEEIK